MEHSIIEMTPSLAEAFHEADAFWQAALELEFGGDAGQARYEERGQGADGTKLRHIAENRHAAMQAWAAAAFGA